jgi:signal transduction histidine kinase
VNPRCDNVPSLAGFLEEQTGKLMRSAGLDYRLEMPEDVPDLPLDSETRHEIVLCVREACTNVIRHARARRVQVNLTFARGNLTLTIADDGKGIEAAQDNGARNGLANLHSRMRRIGGKLSCRRGVEGGTVLAFEVPLGARPSTAPK